MNDLTEAEALEALLTSGTVQLPNILPVDLDDD